MSKAVKVVKGKSGFGGPLILKKEGKKDKVLCVAGGELLPVALKIGELLDAEVIDGFKTGIPDEEVIVAIVDCGGVARCGVYPKKRIPTVNVTPVGAEGPLAKFITEDIYVSDVSVGCISYADESEEAQAIQASGADGAVDKEEYMAKKKEGQERVRQQQEAEARSGNIIAKIGKAVGNVMNKFYAAGRETIDTVIKTVLPFMAFISVIVGIILGTGLGDIIADIIAPASSSLIGMLVISIVCAIPILSPILGPGAVIAQVVGTLIGTQIGLGNINPQYALPALFAIDSQVGGDFIPVGLSLGEATPETIEVGTPAILFSRLITGPLAVLIAYAASIGLYS